MVFLESQGSPSFDKKVHLSFFQSLVLVSAGLQGGKKAVIEKRVEEGALPYWLEFWSTTELSVVVNIKILGPH